MEKLKTRGSQRFHTLFIKYLAVFCIMTLALLALTAFGFMLALSTGFIQPANAVETQINAQKQAIASSEEVTPDLVPSGALYAVYSESGDYLYGDMSSTGAQVAWDTIEQGKSSSNGNFYTRIYRPGQICIMQYKLQASYGSPWANTYLPSPIVLLIGLFLVLFIAATTLIAVRFGRTLSRKMAGLNEATENIQNQNLDFRIQPSGIYEIDQTLTSMDAMRQALKESLEKQWEMEQARKQQISALAHDIKAPVTVIRGNADLLGETGTSDIQKTYLRFIESGTAQLEAYVSQMLEVTRSQTPYSLDLKPYPLSILLADWKKHMDALAGPRRIVTQLIKEALSEDILGCSLMVDKELLTRAFLNMLVNAAEYTPEQGSIVLKISADEDILHFALFDSGPGFSAEDLAFATTEFYRGDKARTPGAHFGMGLFIARSIAEQHGGRLDLSNAPQGGGCVILSLPLCADAVK